jgi:UDP-N-acetylmuramoyl-L-alanyl-D-glutamate--2,6-diaminopimelate ligase
MTGERRMGLGTLTDAIGPERVVGVPVGDVCGLASDSRAVEPGSVFFALPGAHVDGHDHARQAVDAGAIAVVVERELPDVAVPQLIVDGTRRALADAAAAWYGDPSTRLTVIGVTGTDGKSTVAALVADILRAAGRRPGEIGTVFTTIGDARRPNDDRTTTPGALELQAALAEMVAAGNDSVVMEATSHGLALDRTRNVRFALAVVTTVTSEHLEFHGTIEAYRAAKARLVESAPIAILNADDPTVDYFRARAAGKVITYAIDAEADLRAMDLVGDATGTRFRLVTPSWRGQAAIPLPGRFNVANALAALAVAEALGIDTPTAVAGLAASSGVPGRMERVDGPQPFTVIVDYAHTEDALRKVLDVLRPVTSGRLMVVFGSAGERDATKRAPMGRAAAELADLVVVTDEDPRLEDPRAINEQIADGARAAGARDGERLWVIDDRRAAIAHAIGLARTGDVVLLAGKGHEASMFHGTQKRPWDDRSAARDALAAAGWGTT